MRAVPVLLEGPVTEVQVVTYFVEGVPTVNVSLWWKNEGTGRQGVQTVVGVALEELAGELGYVLEVAR